VASSVSVKALSWIPNSVLEPWLWHPYLKLEFRGCWSTSFRFSQQLNNQDKRRWSSRKATNLFD